MRKFLHVGSGNERQSSVFGLESPTEWHEIRLDIDPSVNPDVVGTITDMSAVESDSMDAVYSSHNIEHIFPCEVPAALSEFLRVLVPKGFVIITCPDLLAVCKAVCEVGLTGTLYMSPAGPIQPIDVLYGHQGYIADGHHYMAHKGGVHAKDLACGASGGWLYFHDLFRWRVFTLGHRG